MRLGSTARENRCLARATSMRILRGAELPAAVCGASFPSISPSHTLPAPDNAQRTRRHRPILNCSPYSLRQASRTLSRSQFLRIRRRPAIRVHTTRRLADVFTAHTDSNGASPPRNSAKARVPALVVADADSTWRAATHSPRTRPTTHTGLDHQGAIHHGCSVAQACQVWSALAGRVLAARLDGPPGGPTQRVNPYCPTRPQASSPRLLHGY